MKWRIITGITILIMAINFLILSYNVQKLKEQVSVLEFNQQTILKSIEVNNGH